MPASNSPEKIGQPDPQLLQRTIHFKSIVYPALRQTTTSGDLVTRMGCDMTSYLMSGFNKQASSFSHCGIVLVENDTPFVYHCIGGEFNPNQSMKREPLFSFSNPADSKRIGVFSPELNNGEQARLVKILQQWHREKLAFDMDFNFYTDNRMYCSEMVAKALKIATSNRMIFKLNTLNGFEFIPVENTYLHPLMTKKFSVDY